MRNDAIAGRVLVFLQQLLVVSFHRLGHFHLQLRQYIAIGGLHLSVSLPRDVQHHIIIMVILLVSVEIPVRRLVVDLHVSHPQRAVDLHLSVEEVGTRISVVQSPI